MNKIPLLLALVFAIVSISVSPAEERKLSKLGTYVQLIPSSVSEIKPIADVPGRERVLDKITIATSPESSPPSFIVSGRVISANNGFPVDRVFIYIGVDQESPNLAAMTNVDGEFKFRLWIDAEHRKRSVCVPPSLAGYLYVDGQPSAASLGSLVPFGDFRLVAGTSRRYPLRELKAISDTKTKK